MQGSGLVLVEDTAESLGSLCRDVSSNLEQPYLWDELYCNENNDWLQAPILDDSVEKELDEILGRVGRDAVAAEICLEVVVISNTAADRGARR